jgi:putative membrane protein
MKNQELYSLFISVLFEVMNMSNSSVINNLVHWFISASALVITAYFVKGFYIKSFPSALITAVFIGLANILIKPILIFLTLPLNVLTLGLFTLVVNGIVLRICASVVSGFEITSWAAAIFGAIILSIISSGLHYLIL